VKNGRKDEQLSTVPAGPAKREREVAPQWAWTEPSVWTERMLDALEKGVKGGKWYSLIDKVYAKETLRAGWQSVKRNGKSGGVDGQTIKQFERGVEKRITDLHERIRTGSYEPQPVRRVLIPKPGSDALRPLGIPTIRDRVVQTALRYVIEPIFEKKFCRCSYGFRPKRSAKDALRQVQAHLDAGRVWVVDVDIERYFDTIPHRRLMQEVETEIADQRVLGLIEAFLKQRVMEGTKSYAALEEGTPQGGVISPLLANIYLHPVDQTMEAEGYGLVRYADDCVVMCATQEEAERALARIRELIEERELTLHPEKTKLVDATAPGGFDFLGYHFEQGRRYPRKKSLRKLKDAVRERTRRTNGHSLGRIIEIINPILRGWFAYFKHSHFYAFTSVDGWVRRRLRTILRRRQHHRGLARGADHQRWPNLFFRQMGLFTMCEAHRVLIQSR
jgi:RNA-directed DNA polymerase